MTYVETVQPPHREPYSEERIVRRGGLDLRLMINRSHGHMRFMDYRVGNYDRKRDLLDEIAREESLRKVFTLVEKSDSGPWRTAGFMREGVYPSFFRTADAYQMGRLYGESGEPLTPSAPLKASANEPIQFPERKIKAPSGLTLETVDEDADRRDLMRRLNGALGALPFARVKPPDIVVHARGGRREGWVCAEIDESFAHATLCFAPRPGDDSSLVLYAYAGNTVVSRLASTDVTNVFGLSAMDDRWSNELFVGLGFRVTGRLAAHLRADESHTSALLWHRRLP